MHLNRRNLLIFVLRIFLSAQCSNLRHKRLSITPKPALKTLSQKVYLQAAYLAVRSMRSFELYIAKNYPFSKSIRKRPKGETPSSWSYSSRPNPSTWIWKFSKNPNSWKQTKFFTILSIASKKKDRGWSVWTQSVRKRPNLPNPSKSKFASLFIIVCNRLCSCLKSKFKKVNILNDFSNGLLKFLKRLKWSYPSSLSLQKRTQDNTIQTGLSEMHTSPACLKSNLFH